MDVFDEQMAVNARGPFLLAREAIPHLLDSRGLIVVVASLMSVEGGAGTGRATRPASTRRSGSCAR